MLSSIAGLTARVNDGLLDADDKDRLRELAQGVSRAFNILPEVRYALVPSSVSHATDVVRVYSHVLGQLGVYRVAEHVNANMEELSSFLTYYSSTQLQYETREQEDSESRTGTRITIMLILLSLVSVPSLVKDASEIDWNIGHDGAALAARGGGGPGPAADHGPADDDLPGDARWAAALRGPHSPAANESPSPCYGEGFGVRWAVGAVGAEPHPPAPSP